MGTKIKLVIILVLGIFLLSGLGFSTSTKREISIRVSSPTPVDTPLSVKGKTCLFIGDSHTTYASGWQDRLCKRTGMIGTNTAVGGKRTEWMLGILKNRIDSRYDYCFIWGGANDMASQIKARDAVSNVQKMVDLCKSKGVKAIVMTGFSPRECIDVRGKGPEWQPYPRRYEEFQQMLQDSIKGAEVIKTHFISRSDRDCSDFCCHMSASGHRKMGDSMISRLKFKTIK